MDRTPTGRRRWRLALAALAAALVIAPASVSAHAELTTSSPADGASVAGPLADPITLTFSEALQAGSHAELLDDGGTTVAEATVDGDRMTFTPAAPLVPGSYKVQWTSVAADKDVARGTFSFTVLEPTLAPPTPSPAPTATSTATPSEAPTEAPSEPPASTAPTESPTPGPDSGSAMDVLVPVVAAFSLVVVAGSWVLFRRRSAS
jgi:methionine-rich copper-binding protein CopC